MSGKAETVDFTGEWRLRNGLRAVVESFRDGAWTGKVIHSDGREEEISWDWMGNSWIASFDLVKRRRGVEEF